MTTPWWDECCVWIEAMPCPTRGQLSDGGSPCKPNLRVFVHEDNVPDEGVIFNYGAVNTQEANCCWEIGPKATAERVFLPKDDCEEVDIQIATPSPSYERCVDCEGDISEPVPGEGIPDEGPGKGWNPDGGPGPGGGGPFDPGEVEPEPPRGVKLKLCSGQVIDNPPRNWWVPQSGYPVPDDGSSPIYIIRVEGLCYELNTANETELPDNADLYFGMVDPQEFENCPECTNGVKAEPCPGENLIEGFERQPDYYVRLGDLNKVDDNQPRILVFERNGFCYHLDREGQSVPIPPSTDAKEIVILPVMESLGECGDCAYGLQATPCDEEEGEPPEYWIEKSELLRPEELLESEAGQDRVYFRIEGRCYSVPVFNEGLPFVRIPNDAETYIPRDSYLDCMRCFCDQPKPEPGYRAYLCWQPDDDIDPDNDVWVRSTSLPDGVVPEGGIYFLYKETCYYIPEDEEEQRIPDSGRIINTRYSYRNCFDCASRGGMRTPQLPGDGGGGRFAGGLPPFPPPPRFMLAGVIPCSMDTSDPANIQAYTNPNLYPPQVYYTHSSQGGIPPFFEECVQVTSFLEDEKAVIARGETIVGFPFELAWPFPCCGTCFKSTKDPDVWKILKCYPTAQEGSAGEHKYLVTTNLQEWVGKTLKLSVNGETSCWRVQNPDCNLPRINEPPIEVTIIDKGPDDEGYENCAHCAGWYKLARCGPGSPRLVRTINDLGNGGDIPYGYRISNHSTLNGCWLVSRSDPPPEGVPSVDVPGDGEVFYPLPDQDLCKPCEQASSSSSSGGGGMASLMGGIGTDLV